MAKKESLKQLYDRHSLKVLIFSGSICESGITTSDICAVVSE
jgi:hypothetical protein